MRLRLALASAMAALLALALPSLIAAAPLPERFAPSPGQVLGRLPQTVEGHFDEPLFDDPAATTVQVFRLNGNRVDTGNVEIDASRPWIVGVELKGPGPGDGIYYALWKVTSLGDGTAATYCTVFFVGDDAPDDASDAGIGLNCRNIPVPIAFEPLVDEQDIPELTPEPTESPSPTPSATATRTPRPSATPSPGGGGGDDGVPVWMVVVGGGVAAALMLVAGILAGVLLGRGGGGSPPAGPPRPPRSGPPAAGPPPAPPPEPPPSAPRPARDPFGRPPPRPPAGGAS